jgi:hypothetical protein
MSEEKVGIEGVEKVIDLATKNVILGIEISKEGLTLDDLKYGPEIFKNLQELVEFVQSKPELGKELKDIDPMEGFALIQKAYSAYNSIKA